MKNILKKLNIHDYLLVLLFVIPFTPYKLIPFYIGNIYWHEVILGIYLLGNVIFLLFNEKKIKELLALTFIQKLFIVFVIILILNFIFSLFLFKAMDKNNLIEAIKVHFNVIRGYGEFTIIFFLFSYNIKNSYLGLQKFFILLLFVFSINLLIPFICLIQKVNIIKIFFDREAFNNFRSSVHIYHYMLPDGALAMLSMGLITYLFKIYQNKYIRLIFILIFILCVIIIFSTYSRIFLPGFIFLILFLIVFILPKRIKIPFLILFIIFLIFFGKESIVGRLSKLGYGIETATVGSGRPYLINEVYNIFAGKPESFIWGIGIGNHFYYSITFMNDTRWLNLSSPHNQLLTIFLDMGLLGYLLFLYFILTMIIQTANRIKSSQDLTLKRLYLCLLGIFVSFLVMSLFADMIISYHPPMTHYLIYLWIIMSLLASNLILKNEIKTF